MPTSTSTHLHFPIPGAQSGDVRLLDIQAVKEALVVIDSTFESLVGTATEEANTLGKLQALIPVGNPASSGGIPIGGTIFAGFPNPLYTDENNNKWLRTGYCTGVSGENTEIANALVPFGGVTYSQFSRNELPSGCYINSLLCSSENFFIGIGRNSIGPTAFKSTDGINWTQNSLGASNLLFSGIAQGNGLFVTVSSGNPTNIAASSPDGINWTPRTLPSTRTWGYVMFANGIFIAGVNTTSNAYATSTDGINWVSRTFPISGNFTKVQYGNGLFLIINGNTTTAYTSPDGINWTVRTLPIAKWWSCISFVNGFFIALANPANTSMMSSDGINWTQGVIPAPGVSLSWTIISGYNGLYLAVASDSSTAMTSTDGVNWTLRNCSLTDNWSGIAVNNEGLFIIGSFSTNTLLTNDPTTDIGMSYKIAASAADLDLYVKYA